MKKGVPLDRLAEYGGKGLWIRAPYMALFKEKKIRAVIRPGKRYTSSDPRSLPLEENLPVRFIRVPGDQSRGIQPELYPDDGTTIRVIIVSLRRIRDLSPQDLKDTAPDTQTAELVRYHLATLYNTELPSLDDWVTIFHFKYTDPD